MFEEYRMKDLIESLLDCVGFLTREELGELVEYVSCYILDGSDNHLGRLQMIREELEMARVESDNESSFNNGDFSQYETEKVDLDSFLNHLDGVIEENTI